MKAGWVSVNVLDLRKEPDHTSERVNQALFGESVLILGEKRGFYRLQKWDNYRGWADRRMVKEMSKRAQGQYEKSLNRVVGVSSAAVYDSSHSKRVFPFFCYYGTRLAMKRKQGRRGIIELPDKTTVSVSFGSLRTMNRQRITGRHLVAEAKKFLGVPYLWGGISPAGFDCSGFLQTVFIRFGLQIPRDTKDQRKTGSRINRSEIRAGDLVFFNRHVGLATAKDRIIHSSRGGGGVRVNSLSPDKTDYREDLDRTYCEARRIV